MEALEALASQVVDTAEVDHLLAILAAIVGRLLDDVGQQQRSAPVEDRCEPVYERQG
jgi:hypothetical protein